VAVMKSGTVPSWTKTRWVLCGAGAVRGLHGWYSVTHGNPAPPLLCFYIS
jgi:hypothetical protein